MDDLCHCPGRKAILPAGGKEHRAPNRDRAIPQPYAPSDRAVSIRHWQGDCRHRSAPEVYPRSRLHTDPECNRDDRLHSADHYFPHLHHIAHLRPLAHYRKTPGAMPTAYPSNSDSERSVILPGNPHRSHRKHAARALLRSAQMYLAASSPSQHRYNGNRGDPLWDRTPNPWNGRVHPQSDIPVPYRTPHRGTEV